MTLALRMGMGNSYGLHITVPAGDEEDFEPFDPELPTAAVLEVTKPEGQHVDWTASIVSQSAEAIVVDYRFNPNTLDLDQDGEWRVWIQWTVVGETPGPRTEVGSFLVVAADHL